MLVQRENLTEQKQRTWPAILVAGVIFAALSLWGAITSEGFLEADSCTHYLYARFAVGELHYLVNVWGRPLVTGIYAIPAALGGRLGVRVTSLCLALGIALVAYRIAKRLGYRWPALAFIFVLAQPLVFLHSFSELTELPFAFFLALAFWAYCAKRWGTMTTLVAILPLARPEGFLFILLGAVALLAHRRWWWIALLPVPLLVWDWAGWEVYGRPAYPSDALWNALPGWLHWVLWLKHEWPYAEQSAYARGYLLHFVASLPAVVGPIVFPAVVIGVWRSLRAGCEANAESNTEAQRHRGKNNENDSSRCLGVSVFKFFCASHEMRCQVLVAVIPLLILGAHSILYWRGKMASNGELRYMLTVAVFWGLLAAEGWEWIFTRLRWRYTIACAGVAALLPAGVQFLYPVLPLRLSSDWEQVREAAGWYKGSATEKAYPRLLVSNPAFFYFMDVSPNDRGRMLEWRKETVGKCPPGTLLVWDHDYAMFNSDRNRIVTIEEILAAGWVEDIEAENQFEGGERWRVFRSRVSMVPER